MGVLLSQDAATPLLGQDGSQLLDQAAGLALPASLYPLAITAEILVNSAWADISQYVYSRDTISITGGQPDEASSPQPSQCTMTLDNRDGRFSPNNAAGPFYPYLQRNVQLRVGVKATSATGNFYQGYRFWGAVAAWPPMSDPSAADIYVPVTASGPLRQVNQGGGQGSALTRYYAALAGVYAPVAYWALEEDPSTTIIGAGVDGGTNMTVTAGTPAWKAISAFNGSGPIAVLNGSTWDGLTGSFGSSGDDVFGVPGTYQWQASTSVVNARVKGGSGGGGWGSGGANGFAGAGGGEFAQEAALAVTIGSFYTVIVGGGGKGGSASGPSSDGGASSMQGDAVLVLANPGRRGVNITPGAGGAGSVNSVHEPGGAGAAGAAGPSGGGGGGGSSAGTGAAGNPGSPGAGPAGGAGGAAPAGGARGGAGGTFTGGAAHNGGSGASPGGAGAGAAANGGTGGSGAPGSVELAYAPSTVPSNNVIRFILFVPPHGGNNGAVLLRALTGGTVHQLDCLYVSGGKIQLRGYSIASALLFTSSNLTVGDGVTLMVSMELVNSGTAVAWALSAVRPGAAVLLGQVTGTLAAASIGNVSEIIAGPGHDITKTAMGHISVQYALIPLTSVSKALDGNSSETTVDRFIRLAGEQALASQPQFTEGQDHWGFELGSDVAQWTPVSAALSRSAVTHSAGGTRDWPADGASSMLITATGESSLWYASSPAGTAGYPVVAGDRVSAAADVYAPAQLGAVGLNIDFYTAAGAYVSTTSGAAQAVAAGQVVRGLSVVTPSAGAPPASAFFRVTAADSESVAPGTQLFVDNVRISPRMGAQTRKEYAAFLKEIQALDQGILKESKTAWGLGYVTRIGLINQPPTVTLDFSAAHLSGELKPVIDDLLTKNHIVVKRHKGSKVTITLNNGTMSVQEPPAGAGRAKKTVTVLAEADEQLLALAQHLLNLGTDPSERYPAITVQPARPALASLMSACAGVEVGSYVKIINLPSWYPAATAQQMVIGYSEVLSQTQWDITWNCKPYAPFILSAQSIRRW